MAKRSTPVAPKMDMDFQAEDDHRTMMRSAEIQIDGKRMRGVKRHQRKQQKAMSLMQRQMLQGRR